ncbi:tannase and feruloyl esterase [Dendrothele bispora CBS 962.96]|uniref:Carboxylic ester hydrolase n=1 Tax=Dendrothele bispora (strain CBS 962.96) TaxID=1314807 RepID=A0A4S8M1A3_DENBC|nr:tannase and feruloyl esterase [Dendrothele bispora CBS 962.96]
MSRHLLVIAILFSFGVSISTRTSAVVDNDFDHKCSVILSQTSIPNVTAFFFELIPAGTNLTLPDNNITCARPSQVVFADTCRITLFVESSEISGTNMEIWLPRNWTGRFLSTGNGGLSGCIQYENVAYASALGFATVGVNNGHNGTSGGAFLNNPGVIEDFAYRSMHTGVVVGKQLTDIFYGSSHNKSYYLGCSTGGRQGLKSVQDFPEDFDGVIAGAPANDWSHLMAWIAHFYGITGDSGSSRFITAAQWVNVVHPDVMTQCDLIDGANTVRKFYSPFYIDGEFAFPRLQPGAEDEWWRDVIYSDPNFDADKLGDADYALSALLDPKRNGKLLTYHGQSDTRITPKNSERYYEHVSKTMNLSNSALDDFYRFFRISGMGHCSGGNGAWEIGQTFLGAASNISFDSDSMDPERNVLMAMVRWVEEDVAPDTLLGTKFLNDTAKSGVQFSRKHCRYPFSNTYDGFGDSTRPESWQCL